jgi:SAM-dependent methyltransferase
MASAHSVARPERRDRDMPISMISPPDIRRWALSTPIVHAVARSRASVETDPRCAPALRTLRVLRKRGRRSIRVVDARCGDGSLLLHLARAARALGFVAIEGRGIDRDPALVAAARLSAALLRDPAIGLTFDAGDGANALLEEAELPADMVFYAEDDVGAAAIATAAGATVFGTPGFPNGRAA